MSAASETPAVAHAAALVTSCADEDLVLHASDLRDKERWLGRTLVRLKSIDIDESAAAEYGDVRRALTALNRELAVVRGHLTRALAVVRVYQRAIDEELLERAAAEEAEEALPDPPYLPDISPEAGGAR